MNPLVSIIVPCYNQAQYLPETLDSVLAQTYPYWECIIVNDGSPDNTEEIAKHYCEKDNRFKYLFKENGEAKINDRAMVALALLIAVSDPKEKNTIIKLVINLIKN